jgi:hypothetical protein
MAVGGGSAVIAKESLESQETSRDPSPSATARLHALAAASIPHCLGHRALPGLAVEGLRQPVMQHFSPRHQGRHRVVQGGDAPTHHLVNLRHPALTKHLLPNTLEAGHQGAEHGCPTVSTASPTTTPTPTPAATSPSTTTTTTPTTAPPTFCSPGTRAWRSPCSTGRAGEPGCMGCRWGWPGASLGAAKPSLSPLGGGAGGPWAVGHAQGGTGPHKWGALGLALQVRQHTLVHQQGEKGPGVTQGRDDVRHHPHRVRHQLVPCEVVPATVT